MEQVLYVVLFILFLVAMKFIIPYFNKGVSKMTQAMGGGDPGKGNLTESQTQQLRQLASMLGLNFELNTKSEDSKVWQGGGAILKGVYRDKSLEMRFLMETKEWAEGLRHGYSYDIDYRIVVKANKMGKWRIEPKDKHVVGRPVGLEEFDSKLSFQGDRVSLKLEHLKKIAAYGWMDLTLKEGSLTFVDSFMSYIQRTKGSMAMIGKVHPIWKTSTSNFNFNLESARAFVDLLVDIAS